MEKFFEPTTSAIKSNTGFCGPGTEKCHLDCQTPKIIELFTLRTAIFGCLGPRETSNPIIPERRKIRLIGLG